MQCAKIPTNVIIEWVLSLSSFPKSKIKALICFVRKFNIAPAYPQNGNVRVDIETHGHGSHMLDFDGESDIYLKVGTLKHPFVIELPLSTVR